MYRGGNVLIRIYKVLLNGSIRKHCNNSSDYFGSSEDYESFTENKHSLIDGYGVEVMVHPVYDDEGILSDVLHERYLKLQRLH